MLAAPGESVYSDLGRVRVRTDKDPVWLDLIGEGRGGEVYIRPGIGRRDGKKLVWAWAKDWYRADPKDIPDWGTRPKSFEVKKEGPWEKKTLYRGTGRYAQD